MKTKKIKETIKFTHKDISVIVKIDYKNGTVSFVKSDETPYHYIFADRTHEYLGGWVLVLEALQEATKFANERLLEYEEEVKSENIEMMIEMSEAIKKKEKE